MHVTGKPTGGNPKEFLWPRFEGLWWITYQVLLVPHHLVTTEVPTRTHSARYELGPVPGARSVQRTFCFLFTTPNGLRAERSLFSEQSRVTN